jgi:hypothetical protein
MAFQEMDLKLKYKREIHTMKKYIKLFDSEYKSKKTASIHLD